MNFSIDADAIHIASDTDGKGGQAVSAEIRVVTAGFQIMSGGEHFSR